MDLTAKRDAIRDRVEFEGFISFFKGALTLGVIRVQGYVSTFNYKISQAKKDIIQFKNVGMLFRTECYSER